jgi:hypothetical protein
MNEATPEVAFLPIFAKQRKRPGRYFHRVAAVEARRAEKIRGKRTISWTEIYTRWLCNTRGDPRSVLAWDVAEKEICPYCEDARLGPAVYRCYAEDGQLLYVGATAWLTRRIEQHGRATPWWPEVADFRATRYPDMESAFAAEVRTIKTENPFYNQRGYGPSVYDAADVVRGAS